MAIPRDCETLAEQVPLPSLSTTKSPKQAAAEHRAGLIKADNNLAATRRCQADQRERFARGGS